LIPISAAGKVTVGSASHWSWVPALWFINYPGLSLGNGELLPLPLVIVQNKSGTRFLRHSELSVCRSADEEAPVEPTAESSEEQLEGEGRPLEAEPPLITSSHGLSFWMLIVVCFYRAFFCLLGIPRILDTCNREQIGEWGFHLFTSLCFSSSTSVLFHHFYRATLLYDSAVLGVVILSVRPSPVCPSDCPSVTRMLCD